MKTSSRLENLFINNSKEVPLEEALDIDSIKSILAGIALSGSIMLTPGVSQAGTQVVPQPDGSKIEIKVEGDAITIHRIGKATGADLSKINYARAQKLAQVIKQSGVNKFQIPKEIEQPAKEEPAPITKPPKEEVEKQNRYGQKNTPKGYVGESEGISDGQANIYTNVNNPREFYTNDYDEEGKKKSRKKPKGYKPSKSYPSNKLTTRTNRDIEEAVEKDKKKKSKGFKLNTNSNTQNNKERYFEPTYNSSISEKVERLMFSKG